MNKKEIFAENYIYKENETVNIRNIIKALNLKIKQEDFENYAKENKLIYGEISIIYEEPNYKLNNYKEKKIKVRDGGELRSVMSGRTMMTSIAEELEKNIKDMYESYKNEKEKDEEIKNLRKEIKELYYKKEKYKEKSERLSREYKNDIKNPECFFDELKKVYPEIEDIEIKVRIPTKKNKVKRKIINGNIKMIKIKFEIKFDF